MLYHMPTWATKGHHDSCVKQGVNGARKCVKVTLNINAVKNARPSYGTTGSWSLL